MPLNLKQPVYIPNTCFTELSLQLCVYFVMPSCSFLSERGHRRRGSALGLWWVNPSITQKHFYRDKPVRVHFRLSLFSAIIVAFQTHKATQWNTIVHGWSIKLSLRGSLLLSDYRAWIPSLWEVWRPTPTEQSPARPCPAQLSPTRRCLTQV